MAIRSIAAAALVMSFMIPAANATIASQNQKPLVPKHVQLIRHNSMMTKHSTCKKGTEVMHGKCVKVTTKKKFLF